jgi:hypothetical protein
MGLGYWLTEQAIYDPTTGLQLNTGTWVCHWAPFIVVKVALYLSLLIYLLFCLGLPSPILQRHPYRFPGVPPQRRSKSAGNTALKR